MIIKIWELLESFHLKIQKSWYLSILENILQKNKFKDVNEMDWYEEIKVNDDLKVTLLPAVHWSKRSLTDMNKTLWGNFLIEYKDKKILFACDTGLWKYLQRIR